MASSDLTSDPMNPEVLSVLRLAEQDPDAPLIVTPTRTHSRSEVARRVRQLMAWFEPAVSRERQRPIAFVAATSTATVEALLALIELGIPAVPLHERWSSAERKRAVAASDAHLLTLPDAATLSTKSIAFPSARHEIDAEMPLAIVFSSGSSGDPRGVILSRRAFIQSARATAAAIPWQENDCWHSCLPLAHVGGLSIVTRCLLAGKRLSLLDDGERQFDAAAQHQAMRTCHCTHVSLVPAQLAALLETEQACPEQLRVAIVGGAALAPSMEQRALKAGWPIFRTYGLTEACSQVTLARSPVAQRAAPSDELHEVVGAKATEAVSVTELAPTCGPPLPHVELRFRDGLIEVRSPSLLSGILPGGETGLKPDGWLRTSDVGYLDERGELVVLGRADDVIVTGGENVSPQFVEGVLLEHPDIRAACVFGIPHARWGQEVAAALVVRDERTLPELGDWLRARLASFQRPRRFAIALQLPTTASGKVDRRACARELSAHCRALADSP